MSLAARARRAVQRWRLRREDAARAATRSTTLDDVQRRVELVLAALYGRSFAIEAATEARRPSWIMRLLGQRAPAPPLPTHEGDVIRLPRAMPGASSDEALARWRLMALEQAERAVRGSGALATETTDALEHALFAVAEGACVDRALAGRGRLVADAVRAARTTALAARPPLALVPAAERDVERLIGAALGGAAEPGPGADAVPPPDPDATAERSLAWARAAASTLRRRHGDAFRAVLPVPHWGTLPDRDSALAERLRDASSRVPPVPFGSLQDERISRDARRTEESIVQPEGSSPHQRAIDVPPPDSEARAIAEPGAIELDRHLPGVAGASAPDEGPARSGTTRVAYPEWDALAKRYRPRGATVVVADPPESDDPWIDTFVRQHAALLRRVRARFEPLRAQRVRLHRQRAGDEIDVAAYVDAHADRRLGRVPDDRLYAAVRPARRALAIAVVADVSGSTDAPVAVRRGAARQIIDIEKEALVVASEALDALGDPFAVLTFSSRGAHAVHVTTLKDFRDRADATMRRRIAAMRPTGNTRLGAAVRHATALLTRQPAGHRLLLLLSDGRPNDADGYQGPYATEDARHAILEARAAGVYPFCLTVDQEEAEYLPHVFGPTGHALLRHVDQLPFALVGAVRQLLGGH